MKHSIKKQITYIFLVILAGTVLSCMLANLFFLKSYYLLNKRRNINEAYSVLNEASRQGLLMDSSFHERLRVLCEVSDISVVVLDNDSNIIASISSDDTNLVRQLSDNELISQLYYTDEEPSFQIIRDLYSGNKYLQMCGVLYNNEKFLIRCAYVAVEDSVLIANKFLFYVGLIGLIIGCGLTVVIADRITKPIVRLTEISTQMANLDFNAKYESSGENEVDVLGENINMLSDKLEETISELKTANSELLKDIEKRDKIEDMRQEFISNVSHELKTPIALIQSYSEGLKEGIIDDEESRDYYLDVIIDESNRMNLLVKFGNKPLEIERFDIVELLKNKIAASGIILKQNDIKLEFEEKDPLFVWSDEFRTEEVIQNYLSNAIHYCMNEKIIKIFIEKKEETVRINVYNSGNPIKEEDMQYIWDKFYKADKARSRDYGGSGIGLSIVKAIMTSFDMDYGCSNTDDGVIFYFELPIK